MFKMQDAEDIRNVAAVGVGIALVSYAFYCFYPVVIGFARLAGL